MPGAARASSFWVHASRDVPPGCTTKFRYKFFCDTETDIGCARHRRATVLKFKKGPEIVRTFSSQLRVKFRTDQRPKKFRGARINSGCFALARSADGERQSGADAALLKAQPERRLASNASGSARFATKSGLR